jgi:protein-S-isoprenylcysteine O-methyltransferase Ste14
MGILWLVLLIAVWGGIHSLLASTGFKSATLKLVGPAGFRVYRLAFNLFSAFSFIPILVVAYLLPDKTIYDVHLPWSILFFAGELLAFIALLVGFIQSQPFTFLGVQQLSSAPESSSKLTTTGLYQYIRHPLYTSGLALIWLIPRMTINLLTINLALTAYILIGATLEERKLIKEFGQEYRDYINSTPMLIPFLKGNKLGR